VNPTQDVFAGPSVTVTLEVVAVRNDGWRVRAVGGEGRGVFLSSEFGFRLSPANLAPARFKLPRWLWARLAEMV
jgi:hypothetical protein